MVQRSAHGPGGDDPRPHGPVVAPGGPVAVPRPLAAERQWCRRRREAFMTGRPRSGDPPDRRRREGHAGPRPRGTGSVADAQDAIARSILDLERQVKWAADAHDEIRAHPLSDYDGGIVHAGTIPARKWRKRGSGSVRGELCPKHCFVGARAGGGSLLRRSPGRDLPRGPRAGFGAPALPVLSDAGEAQARNLRMAPR
jgi:hypothetical protein